MKMRNRVAPHSNRPPKKPQEGIWGTLTMITLGLTVLVSIYYIAAFFSPELAPFGAKSEPTLVTLLNTPTPKPTIAVTDTPIPSWTPQPSPTLRPTATPKPSMPTRTPRPTVIFTLPPTPTETLGPPTATTHPYPFRLSDEGVTYTRYFFSSECNWLGIAGEVIDQEGNPITGISVVVNGGGLNNVVTTSGNAPDYAPSGWEHFLDSQPKAGDFTIQLWHQGQPVSELVEVQTSQDCRRNLAYLIFQVAWEGYTP